MNWTVVLVAAIAAIVLVKALHAGGRRLTTEWRDLKIVVEDINGAVNHRPEGAPTLYQLAETAATTADGLEKLETKVDEAIEVDQAAHARLEERLDRNGIQ